MVTPISFSGIDINTDQIASVLKGAFDSDKVLTDNDILSDGQVFGRSKVSERKLVLNMVLSSYSAVMQASLNRMVTGNALKPLVIDTDMGRLIGYAEVASLATSDDSVLFKSIQLTMPDPHWYALAPDILSLEPHIDNGVIFGDVTRIQLDAGASDAAVRTLLDAAGSDDNTRTTLDAGGSD
ncbi:phage tail protein [Ethanoligenens sp.]|uniref:phage tail protein n=1 Tax=Ethanoligenens sp. TaxID=2099655 RepID=UPI0039E8153D